MSLADESPPLRIAILGPLEAWLNGRPVQLGGAKQRTLLALLALNANRVVATNQLLGTIWPDVPDRAHASMQVYVSNLRRLLSFDGAEPVLVWRSPGYVLNVPSESVDLGRFRSMVEDARRHHAAGRDGEAVDLLRAALQLWRGGALEGLVRDGGIDRHARQLEAERRSALELRIDLDLALGRARELLSEVQALVDQEPFDEGMAGRLMSAYYQAGRQADSLKVYRNLRDVLADELGVDPSPPLRALEADILAQAPSLTFPPARDHPGVAETFRWPDVHASAWLQTAQGERIPVDRAEMIIGRGDDCDIALPHVSVSRRHLAITRDGARHFAVDLNSTNGTTLDGRRIEARQPAELKDGTGIGVGASMFTFRTSEGSEISADLGA